jgi:hypothetical protein
MTKSKIAIVTTLATMLVAGASSAMAFDRQATDDALGYASVQAARAGVPSGAFASAQPGRVRIDRFQSSRGLGE